MRRSGRLLIWRGHLQPSALSRTYLVEVRYMLGKLPRTRVVTRLKTRPGESLPHVWHHTYRVLCLHETVDWHSGMLVANTTVPWTCEWLFFYEIWLVTGTWDGGGHWPTAHER
jgi:hypothetical protein